VLGVGGISAAIGLLVAAGLALHGGAEIQTTAGGKTMFDTVLGSVSFLTAALFVLRFRSERDVSVAAVAYGLALIGLSSLLLAYGRSVPPAEATTVMAIAFGGRVLGVAVIALACLDIPRGHTHGDGWVLLLYGAVIPTVVLTLSLALWTRSEVAGVLIGSGGVPAERALAIPWLMSIIQLGLVALTLAGAYAARLKAVGDDDGLARHMSVGLVLLAMARVYLLINPAVPNALHPGDVARGLGHVVILWGVTWALIEHWHRASVQRAIDERLVVASKLHDGIAQDLALLTAQSRMLSHRTPTADDLKFVATVAQHALDESRRTISELRGLDEGGEIALPDLVAGAEDHKQPGAGSVWRGAIRPLHP